MDHVEQGRDAYAAGSWGQVCAHLEQADRGKPLGPEDVERLAVATYLVGREEDSTDVWARAFRHARSVGDLGGAVRSAFWIAFVLLNRGDLSGGNGWTTRARRLLDSEGEHDAEAGHISYLEATHAIFSEGADAVPEGFATAIAVGDRMGDTDLATLARLGLGRVLIRMGRADDGRELLDEAMVAVTAREVSPIVVGDAYCTAIDGCWELFDLPRARRWTSELSAWCDKHRDLVAFRGQCLLHRAEILELAGEWPASLEDACHAEQNLARPTGQLARGAAWYRRGELHRLRGELDAAEHAYDQARHHGREPQPGLALLLLASGRADAAASVIRRRLAEARSDLSRSRLLPTAVQILLAVDDLDGAGGACDQLGTVAAAFRSRLLHAHAAFARGSVELARGHTEQALVALREALEGWHEIEVPYEAARSRVLIASACRQLGDDDTATSEIAAARATFARLGAVIDLAALDARAVTTSADRHGLTPRELEVLRELASGRTNREIAEQLVISERTVDRHVSNILTKFGSRSRTAATAYAYEHDLL